MVHACSPMPGKSAFASTRSHSMEPWNDQTNCCNCHIKNVKADPGKQKKYTYLSTQTMSFGTTMLARPITSPQQAFQTFNEQLIMPGGQMSGCGKRSDTRLLCTYHCAICPSKYKGLLNFKRQLFFDTLHPNTASLRNANSLSQSQMTTVVFSALFNEETSTHGRALLTSLSNWYNEKTPLEAHYNS